jgi:amino acid transporter
VHRVGDARAADPELAVDEHRQKEQRDPDPDPDQDQRQQVLLARPPPVLGSVHPTRRTPWVAIVFTTAIAFGPIFYVTAFANSSAISLLGGTTSLLLLAVFAMVNVAVLVLRRDVQEAGGHFKTPMALPVIGCLASLYLVTPLSGRTPR